MSDFHEGFTYSFLSLFNVSSVCVHWGLTEVKLSDSYLILSSPNMSSSNLVYIHFFKQANCVNIIIHGYRKVHIITSLTDTVLYLSPLF